MFNRTRGIHCGMPLLRQPPECAIETRRPFLPHRVAHAIGAPSS
ncbi:hypothetical protein [Xanthomonas translucens]|nr:hypothetical protein [Xanthomonas translucens]